MLGSFPGFIGWKPTNVWRLGVKVPRRLVTVEINALLAHSLLQLHFLDTVRSLHIVTGQIGNLCQGCLLPCFPLFRIAVTIGAIAPPNLKSLAAQWSR